MDFITGKHLSRRTFVRGVGATVALPFLDAMVPAGRLWGRTVEDPTRLVCIEMVHGAAGSSDWGASLNLWSPATVGRGTDLTPTALSPLKDYQEYLTVIIDDIEDLMPYKKGSTEYLNGNLKKAENIRLYQ